MLGGTRITVYRPRARFAAYRLQLRARALRETYPPAPSTPQALRHREDRRPRARLLLSDTHVSPMHQERLPFNGLTCPTARMPEASEDGAAPRQCQQRAIWLVVSSSISASRPSKVVKSAGSFRGNSQLNKRRRQLTHVEGKTANSRSGPRHSSIDRAARLRTGASIRSPVSRDRGATASHRGPRLQPARWDASSVTGRLKPG